MNLPTGTVTFLFTDIVGSTRLWEEQPEAMGVALARHDELLRQAPESSNGYVFKTIGDALREGRAMPREQAIVYAMELEEDQAEA